jgi:Leucine-rich repeat (LRR) protein
VWPRNQIDNKVTHDLLPRLARLRVLSLANYSNVVELPDSMGKLKHLRYLNLSATSIKRLPEAVSTAYHLQTLILENCKELVELPDSVGHLKHLLYVKILLQNK